MCDAIVPCDGQIFSNWSSNIISAMTDKEKGINDCAKKLWERRCPQCQTKPFSNACKNCTNPLCPGYSDMIQCGQCSEAVIKEGMSNAQIKAAIWNNCTKCGKVVPIGVSLAQKKKRKKQLIIAIVLGSVGLLALGVLMFAIKKGYHKI